ncbi:hypothetical protein [Chitinophaga rupis]|nr:hypothetical protein [Chitinophaga rupis]
MPATEILSDISIWSILLPLLVALCYIRKLSADSLYVAGIVLLATIPQLLRFYIKEMPMLYFAYNIYTPLEFAGLYGLFHNKFFSPWALRIFKIAAIAYVFITIVIVGLLGLIHRFLNEWVCLNNLVYTIWILVFIIQEYYEEPLYQVNLRRPFFWYLSGLFFYAPCTLLIFSLWHYIKSMPGSSLSYLLIIHSVFNINMYLLFTIGFWMDAGRKQFNIR